MFTEEDFTDEHLESTTKLYESILKTVSEAIGKGRSKEVSEVNKWFEKGIFNSKEAIESKLVDGTHFKDSLYELITSELNSKKENFLYSSLYYQRKGDYYPLNQNNKIAVIYATGEIGEGESKDTIGSDTIARAIRLASENSVGIIIRVDSPGGSAIASDIINHEIIKAKEKGCIVVISMASLAASGGYWISMNANKIMATEFTITGSIGVVGLKLNLREFFDKKLGVTFGTKYKNDESSKTFSQLESNGKFQDEAWKGFMENFYEDFVTRVSNARSMKKEDVEKIAQGKVHTGSDAISIGLIDFIGDFDDSVELTKKVTQYSKRKESFFRILSKEKGNN